jgi:hypothetical protein
MENEKEPEQRACAVCARILHKAEIEGETHWVHQDLGMGEESDHPAVPVDPGEVHTQHRCDFCNDDNPTWILPVKPFDITDFQDTMGMDLNTGGNYLACEPCAKLIDKNQWTALQMRVTQSWRERHGADVPDEAQTSLGRYYRKIRKNITGGLRHFDPKEGR